MESELFSLTEVARRCGLRPSAVRYYEDMGLLEPMAWQSGRHGYGRAELRRLAFITLCREVGLQVQEIRSMLDQESPWTWQNIVRRRIAELDRQIARAQATRRQLQHSLVCPSDTPLACTHVRRESDRSIDVIGGSDRRGGSPRNPDVPGRHG